MKKEFTKDGYMNTFSDQFFPGRHYVIVSGDGEPFLVSFYSYARMVSIENEKETLQNFAQFCRGLAGMARVDDDNVILLVSGQQHWQAGMYGENPDLRTVRDVDFIIDSNAYNSTIVFPHKDLICDYSTLENLIGDFTLLEFKTTKEAVTYYQQKLETA